MRQAGRAVRVLWPGRNALRRRWDRIESAVVIGLVALFLIAVPLAAIAAGRAADRSVLRQGHGEQSWRQVTATLSRRDSRRLQSSASGTAAVWAAADGRPTGPPGGRANLDLEVSLTAASTALALACVLVLAGAGARCLLDRQRMAGWEAGWRAVGPQWSRRP